jgi:SNF2 family DNA or RNA helicase
MIDFNFQQILQSYNFIKIARFTGELLSHQSDAIKKLNDSDSLLLYHGLGSGKTITSIAATENEPVDVIVPASLRENYYKEMKKFTKNEKGKNIQSYNKFLKEGPTQNVTTAVFDEPQKVGRTSAKSSQAVVNAAHHYKKRILLTGTPAMNNPSELAPILRILSPEEKSIPLNPSDFNEKFIGTKIYRPGFFKSLMGARPEVEIVPKNVNILKKAIEGKVHYYEPSREEFPERIDEIREVPSSKEQKHYYSYVTKQSNPIIAAKIRSNLPLSKQELNQLNAFMTAARQVSNTTLPYGGKEKISPKINEVINDFIKANEQNPNHKGLIYSNYLNSGIMPIGKELENNGVPVAYFTGGMSDAERKKSVEDYNSGKVKAILVSSSGTEGLDLKGTRTIQIVEPHWNKSRIEQVIGRGIRYKSHERMPENERNVKVIKYHTTLEPTFFQKMFGKKGDTSADQYLNDLSDKKQELLDKFLDILKEEGKK